MTEPITKPVKWIIVGGSPIDGLFFVGPFDEADDATDHAEQTLRNVDWWIAEIAAR